MNRLRVLPVVVGLVACLVIGRALVRAAPTAPAAPAPALPRPPRRSIPVAVRSPPYVPPPAAPEPEAEPSADPKSVTLDDLIGPRRPRTGDEPRRAIVPSLLSGMPTMTPEDSKLRGAAYLEMARQTRYRDLVFTRRKADDQTIAYLADEWVEADDEIPIARLIRSGVTAPDGGPTPLGGFWDLPEPYGTILLRVGGQETVLRFRPPSPAPDAAEPSAP